MRGAGDDTPRPFALRRMIPDSERPAFRPNHARERLAHVRHFLGQARHHRRGRASRDRAEGAACRAAPARAVDDQDPPHGVGIPGPVPGSDARSRDGRPEEAVRRDDIEHQVDLRYDRDQERTGEDDPGPGGGIDAVFEHDDCAGYPTCPRRSASRRAATDPVALGTAPVAPPAADLSVPMPELPPPPETKDFVDASTAPAAPAAAPAPAPSEPKPVAAPEGGKAA